MLPDPFYKTNITWIPKPHKDITRKEKRHGHGQKLLNKIRANQTWQYLLIS